MSLQVVPISIKRACAWVSTWHRKLPRIQGGLFAIACADGGRLCGVAVVGNPARMAQDGWTAEIVRVATDGTRNACSFLMDHKTGERLKVEDPDHFSAAAPIDREGR